MSGVINKDTLRRRKAEIKCSTSKSGTKLLSVCIMGDTKTASSIIQKAQTKGKEPIGNVVNAKDDKTGYTPLHFAAEGCYVDLVSLLLEKGADSNIINNSGASPLHIAVRIKDNYKIVTLLLDHKANPNSLDGQR